ncbi:MAG TPA: AI-2E family transporter [Actinomycetota bacterium]|nr:AI-2E family transporter [Actinomycetota bacterium]
MNDDRTRVLGHPFVAAAARWGVVAWAGIGVLVLGFIVLRYVLYPIRIVFPPLAVALILVYVLNPVVSRLAQRMPRLVGALLTYLVVLTLVGMGLSYLIPVVADQVTGFARSLPGLVDRVVESLDSLAGRFNFRIDAEAALNAQSQRAVLDYIGSLLSLTRGVFHFVLVVILGPILGFYLLVDLPKIQRGIVSMVPERRRAGFLSVMEKLGRAVGGFFRGQLLVSLFVGLASAIVLWAVGLPYWAVVGMVTGLFNLIPLIGPWIGGIVAAFIAFTASPPIGGLLHLDPGWPLAIGSGIGLALVQQIDNHILSPNIVARTVKLHPVTVMLALLAGGTLLGLWGMLLAVPSVAAAKILLLHAWDTRMTWPPPKVGSEGPEAVPAGPEPSIAGRRDGSRRVASGQVERGRSSGPAAASSSNGQEGLRAVFGAVRRGWRRLRGSGADQPTRPV